MAETNFCSLRPSRIITWSNTVDIDTLQPGQAEPPTPSITAFKWVVYISLMIGLVSSY